MPVIRFKSVSIDGTGGFADIVVPTMGGNFVKETEGAGGPVVTPGGLVDGTAGLTPAKCDIYSLVFHSRGDFMPLLITMVPVHTT